MPDVDMVATPGGSVLLVGHTDAEWIKSDMTVHVEDVR